MTSGNMKFYTGIGSRETPKEVMYSYSGFHETANQLYLFGWTLRSGGADGADSAFELGAADRKEIYLPWKGFNGNSSPLYNISDEAYELAATIHPAWERLSGGAKNLHARNCYQILGLDLKTPSEFVICWTKDGKDIGGTRTAIVLARQNNIPVYNLGSMDSQEVWNIIQQKHLKI